MGSSWTRHYLRYSLTLLRDAEENLTRNRRKCETPMPGLRKTGNP